MSIQATIQKTDQEFKADLEAGIESQALKTKYLSKNGLVKKLYEDLKHVSAEEKAICGQQINALRSKIADSIEAIQNASKQEARTEVDISRQPYSLEQGTLHPINLMLNQIIDIFKGFGFDIIDDNEIDTEENCFDKLRIPSWHPARDTQDTFYIQDHSQLLLRTHTTATQPKFLKTHEPPIKVLSVGKVYRSDEIDATHTPMFHQIDGFMVDKNISLPDLKGVLEVFAKQFIPGVTKTRFRPHYFSYTEPSLELDVQCFLCQGKGCKACKHQGWIEILGAGMMHPDLFTQAGYPPDTYTGFAFGMGLERLVMQRYGIDDIRYLYNNDIRLLKQITR